MVASPGTTTKHGKRRFRERVKLPARALKRMVEQAKKYGKRPDELPLPARLKVLSQQARYDRDNHGDPIIYRGFIFIFSRDQGHLITVYPLAVPDEYMRED